MERGLSPDCQDKHERLRILEVKYSIQDKKLDEILSTIKCIKNTVEAMSKQETLNKTEIETLDGRIKNLEDNQKWFVIGIITSLVSAFWHFLKKHV